MEKKLSEGTRDEINKMLSGGMQQLSFEGIKEVFNNLGYVIYNFENYYNSGNENHYDAIMCQIKEKDTGISAFHYKDARRDENFNKMQTLRKNSFAIVSGRILEL